MGSEIVTGTSELRYLAYIEVGCKEFPNPAADDYATKHNAGFSPIFRLLHQEVRVLTRRAAFSVFQHQLRYVTGISNAGDNYQGECM